MISLNWIIVDNLIHLTNKAQHGTKIFDIGLVDWDQYQSLLKEFILILQINTILLFS